MPRTIEISHRTVIFTVMFIGLIWLLLKISSIILGLFVAVLLMTALNPLVEVLVRFKIPRVLAILLVYVLLIASFGFGLASILPPLVDQTTNLANRLPFYLTETSGWLSGLGINAVNPEVLSAQIAELGAIPANIISIIVSFFSNLISVFTVLVLTFYLLLERNNMNSYLSALFGEGKEKKARNFVDKLEQRLGGWVRGELILMTIIGVLTYIGLIALGIPYALPLAIFAGLLEIVPGIGPIISSIPAILLAFTVSPLMAAGVGLLYFVIQQLENNLIVPNIMRRVAGVNPLITMVAIAVGLELAGFLGAILAVPIVILIHVAAVEIFAVDELRALEHSHDKK